MTKPREKWTKENQQELYSTILEPLFEGNSDSLLDYLTAIYWWSLYEVALIDYYGHSANL
jgi:hypothetical protein